MSIWLDEAGNKDGKIGNLPLYAVSMLQKLITTETQP
jgi:hypothetical protein